MERSEAATVVGLGRIGWAILPGLRQVCDTVLPLGRPDLQEIGSKVGPIVVCTRVDSVPEVLKNTDNSRQEDLVLLQNGPLLELTQFWEVANATLGVLWVAVAKRGDKPLPGRETVFFGKHAQLMAASFNAAGITAKAVIDEEELKKELALKVLWLSLVPVLAACHSCTVGGVVEKHRGALLGLLGETAPVAAAAYNVTLSLTEAAQVIIDYTASIPDFPGGVKELSFRNGWLLDHGKRLGLPQSKHRALLERVGAKWPEV